MIVAAAAEMDRVRALSAQFPFVQSVAAGGETRSESVWRGLEVLPPHVDIVLVHDAARPLVSAPLIDRVIAAVEVTGAAVPGLPMPDTVKRVDSAGRVAATIPRTETRGTQELVGLTAVQTPQGARVSLLRKAYAMAPASAEITDEASLLEAAGAPVQVVPGDPRNIKVTLEEDLATAWLLAGAPEIRTGLGYDIHAFAPPEAGRPLMLGGVHVPHHRGLDGHSDADVVLHAICDALLGAASLGDIGILFPNNDERYRGADSRGLLREVCRHLAAAGWEAVGVDATVVAQAPRLAPYRGAAQAAIEECMGLPGGSVSVKATTAEGLGSMGRGEGISCMAVATIRRSPDTIS